MNKRPLDQIDVIGVQEGLNIKVLSYENNGWKNYTTKVCSNGLFIDIFNNSHAVMLKNGIRSLENGCITCKECETYFKNPSFFKNHNCSPFLTEINCPGRKMMCPKSKYFIALYSRLSGSMTASAWIEGLSKRLGLNHVHHKCCGHGGEIYVDYFDQSGNKRSTIVDGYESTTKTVFEFSGCYYHNHYCHDEPDEKVIFDEKTKVMCQKNCGFKVQHARQCEGKNYSVKIDTTITKAYPHIIVYDFGSMLPDFEDDKNKNLKFTQKQVRAAFSVVDSLNKKITRISNEDPDELGKLFFEELATRRQFIIDDLIKFYDYPNNFVDLDARIRPLIKDYIFQVPVVGYNSRRYDLPLIKKYLIKDICEKEKIIVAKRGNKYIYWVTNDFFFLDLINYVGPGRSLDSFLKSEKIENLKQCFPYKCLIVYEDLSKVYVPKIVDVFNDIKNEPMSERDFKNFCEY